MSTFFVSALLVCTMAKKKPMKAIVINEVCHPSGVSNNPKSAHFPSMLQDQQRDPEDYQVLHQHNRGNGYTIHILFIVRLVFYLRATAHKRSTQNRLHLSSPQDLSFVAHITH